MESHFLIIAKGYCVSNLQEHALISFRGFYLLTFTFLLFSSNLANRSLFLISNRKDWRIGNFDLYTPSSRSRTEMGLRQLTL